VSFHEFSVVGKVYDWEVAQIPLRISQIIYDLPAYNNEECHRQ